MLCPLCEGSGELRSSQTVTPKEAGFILKLNMPSIYQYIRRGKLYAERLSSNGRLTITKASLMEFMNLRKRSAKQKVSTSLTLSQGA